MMSNAETKDAFEEVVSEKSLNMCEAEVASDSGSEQHREDAGVPWHHLQLYRLFGNDADYFLYPKLTVEKQSSTRTRAHHSLANSLNYEHGSAKNLWAKLRSDSLRRLYGVDASFSKDLKLTYEAYVREFVSNSQNFSKRCMYTDKDVPRLDELMNPVSSLLTRENKHKTQVMWRASGKNKDGTAVLLHNSPLPYFINWTGDYNVMSYIPALPKKDSEEDVLDETSLDSQHMESNRDTAGTCKAYTKSKIKGKKNQCIEYDKQVQSASVRIREESAMPYRCVFFTSATPSVTGLYSKKRKELLEAKQYAEHLAEDPSCHRLRDCRQDKTEIGLPQKCTESRTSEISYQATSNNQQAWQPLTLAALLEYKADVKCTGQNNFSYDHTALWSVI